MTYAAISLYFENHYYYHTMIGGEDMGYKTPMEVEELLYSRINNYIFGNIRTRRDGGCYCTGRDQYAFSN